MILLNALSLQQIVLKVPILFVLKDFSTFQFLFFSSACNLFLSLRGSIQFLVIQKLFFP